MLLHPLKISGQLMVPHSLVIGWIPVASPPGSSIPILLLPDGEICYEFYAFIRQPAMRGKSGSWLSLHAQAVALLYEYYSATRAPGSLPSQRHANDFLTDFVAALLHGTIQLDGSDPAGLFWRPKSSGRAKDLLFAMRRFSNFLIEEGAHISLNPQVGERIASLRQRFGLAAQKEHSILAHLKELPHPPKPQAAVPFQRLLTQGQGKGRPIPFPKRYEVEFFAVGLFRRKQRNRKFGVCPHTVRDTLYYLLLMYGGLRKSEPLHLFLQDIVPDPEQPSMALVFLYHPETGSVQGEQTRRSAYLQAKYQLVPRSRLAPTDPMFAGWKSMLLSEETRSSGPRTRVFWRNRDAGVLFWELHKVYMQIVRPKKTSHPYYFVNLSGSGLGRPMTIDAVDDSFSRALARMKLVPDSSLGMSPHCMRHRYAQELVDANLTPALIQICLHHTSLASQAVYTRPMPSQVAEVLSSAAKKIEDGAFDFDSTSLGIRWKSDPLGIFSTTAPLAAVTAL